MIKNLKEFSKWRTHCPFCNNELHWSATNTIASFGKGYRKINVSFKNDILVLKYDGADVFNSTMNHYYYSIAIDMNTNEVTFNRQDRYVWNKHDNQSALKSNKVYFARKCLHHSCEKQYTFSLNVIELTSEDIKEIRPVVSGEYFIIPGNKRYISVFMDHELNKTTISPITESQFGESEIVDGIAFDLNDKEKLRDKLELINLML